MALIRRGLPQRPDEDARQEREDRMPPSGSGGAAQAPMKASAPSFGAPSAGASGGQFGRFVSLGEYLGQNQPQAERMASKIGTSVAQEGKAAQTEQRKMSSSYNRAVGTGQTEARGLQAYAPERYTAAQQGSLSAEQRAKGLGTTGGIETEVKRAYSAAPSTAGESLMDAALAQQAGGPGFAQIQSRYSNLQQMLSDANTRSAAAFDRAQADAAAAAAAKKAKNDEDERRRKEEERIRKENEAAYKADDERFRSEITATPPEQEAEYTPPEKDSSDEEAEKQFGRR